MSVIVRGVKNAFRNGIRTSSIVLILAISMGLALSMLLANQAVKARIDDLKTKVGTNLFVRPAGSANMQGGGEPLKSADADKVKQVAHVAETSVLLNFMLETEGNSSGGPKMFIGSSGPKAGETNLESSIKPGTIGERLHVSGDRADGGEFKLPIHGGGISGNRTEDGKSINVIQGRQLKDDDKNVAVIGKSLAEKNNLKIDSTFKAYGETFTVVGIFDAGTKFANDSVYIPLATAQRLAGAGDEISAINVQVDSIDNLNATVAAIKKALGEDKADVTATEENAMEAVNGLKSVEQISIVGFVVALGAAATVIFLSMLMIVRERRREIGVLKAIGGSNHGIVAQFIVEAIVLVMMGAVVGMGFAVATGNGITNALVNTNASQAASTDDGPSVSAGPERGARPNAVRFGAPGMEGQNARDLVGTMTTNIGLSTLAYGLLAALGIAIVGSAVPAWLIAKVRPAEVLRGE
ncbi:MAG: ABC transporter permease [Candidatus Saccharimonadales bacterium]